MKDGIDLGCLLFLVVVGCSSNEQLSGDRCVGLNVSSGEVQWDEAADHCVGPSGVHKGAPTRTELSTRSALFFEDRPSEAKVVEVRGGALVIATPFAQRVASTWRAAVSPWAFHALGGAGELGVMSCPLGSFPPETLCTR